MAAFCDKKQHLAHHASCSKPIGTVQFPTVFSTACWDCCKCGSFSHNEAGLCQQKSFLSKKRAKLFETASSSLLSSWVCEATSAFIHTASLCFTKIKATTACAAWITWERLHLHAWACRYSVSTKTSFALWQFKSRFVTSNVQRNKKVNSAHSQRKLVKQTEWKKTQLRRMKNLWWVRNTRRVIPYEDMLLWDNWYLGRRWQCNTALFSCP